MELFTPEFGLIFWMFVVFVILLFILCKYAWPYIVKSLDKRAELIDNGVTYATQAKAQLDNATAEGQKYIKDAQLKQTEMLREVAQKKTQLVEQAKADAQKEADKVREQAKADIERERKKSEAELHDQIGDYAIMVAERILRNQLADKDAQYSLINKIIDEIETGG